MSRLRDIRPAPAYPVVPVKRRDEPPLEQRRRQKPTSEPSTQNDSDDDQLTIDEYV